MNLEDRMKNYEQAARTVLPRRMPIIIRVDGKSFSKYTKRLPGKPFDRNFISVMEKVAIALCQEIQDAQLAYTQSDEVSVLLHNYKKFESDAWFGNQVQKMVSVAASIAGATFTANSWCMWRESGAGMPTVNDLEPAYFDARAFVLPEADVNNYFVWRQRDGIRNSIQMFASHHFSHGQLHKKSTSEMIEMCKSIGHDWHALPATHRQGRCVYKHLETVDGQTRSHFRVNADLPRFVDNPAFVNQFLPTEDEAA